MLPVERLSLWLSPTSRSNSVICGKRYIPFFWYPGTTRKQCTSFFNNLHRFSFCCMFTVSVWFCKRRIMKQKKACRSVHPEAVLHTNLSHKVTNWIQTVRSAVSAPRKEFQGGDHYMDKDLHRCRVSVFTNEDNLRPEVCIAIRVFRELPTSTILPYLSSLCLNLRKIVLCACNISYFIIKLLISILSTILLQMYEWLWFNIDLKEISGCQNCHFLCFWLFGKTRFCFCWLLSSWLETCGK